jgi:hypothetical protein
MQRVNQMENEPIIRFEIKAPTLVDLRSFINIDF